MKNIELMITFLLLAFVVAQAVELKADGKVKKVKNLEILHFRAQEPGMLIIQAAVVDKPEEKLRLWALTDHSFYCGKHGAPAQNNHCYSAVLQNAHPVSIAIPDKSTLAIRLSGSDAESLHTVKVTWIKAINLVETMNTTIDVKLKTNVSTIFYAPITKSGQHNTMKMMVREVKVPVRMSHHLRTLQPMNDLARPGQDQLYGALPRQPCFFYVFMSSVDTEFKLRAVQYKEEDYTPVSLDTPLKFQPNPNKFFYLEDSNYRVVTPGTLTITVDGSDDVIIYSAIEQHDCHIFTRMPDAAIHCNSSMKSLKRSHLDFYISKTHNVYFSIVSTTNDTKELTLMLSLKKVFTLQNFVIANVSLTRQLEFFNYDVPIRHSALMTVKTQDGSTIEMYISSDDSRDCHSQPFQTFPSADRNCRSINGKEFYYMSYGYSYIRNRFSLAVTKPTNVSIYLEMYPILPFEDKLTVKYPVPNFIRWYTPTYSYPGMYHITLNKVGKNDQAEVFINSCEFSENKLPDVNRTAYWIEDSNSTQSLTIRHRMDCPLYFGIRHIRIDQGVTLAYQRVQRRSLGSQAISNRTINIPVAEIREAYAIKAIAIEWLPATLTVSVNISDAIVYLSSDDSGCRDIENYYPDASMRCSVGGTPQTATSYLVSAKEAYIGIILRKPYVGDILVSTSVAKSNETKVTGRCKGPEYLDKSGICRRCDSKCKTCVAIDGCVSCENGFVPVNGECQPQSSVGRKCFESEYRDKTGVCRRCPPRCKKCEDVKGCVECIAGMIAPSQDCDVPAGTIPVAKPCYPIEYRDLSGNCRRCPSDCKRCIDGAGCVECQPGMIPSEGSCVPGVNPPKNDSVKVTRSCFASEYRDEIGECRRCPGTCQRCQDKVGCVECSKDHRLVGNECIEVPHCRQDQYLVNFTCFECPENCRCNDPATCLGCVNGASSLNGLCVKECPDRMYSNNGQCVACDPNCVECSKTGSCSRCKGDRYALDGACVPDCHSSGMARYGLNGQCLLGCPHSYVQIANKCEKCPIHCDECQNPDKCKKCEIGFSVSLDGRCVPGSLGSLKKSWPTYDACHPAWGNFKIAKRKTMCRDGSFVMAIAILFKGLDLRCKNKECNPLTVNEWLVENGLYRPAPTGNPAVAAKIGQGLKFIGVATNFTQVRNSLINDGTVGIADLNGKSKFGFIYANERKQLRFLDGHPPADGKIIQNVPRVWLFRK